MAGTLRLLVAGILMLAAAGRVAAEERWKLTFEHEPPKKIQVPPHVPPGLDMYFGQKTYWYVLYRVTNVSKKRIDNMCLKIWVETDDERRLVRPLEKRSAPGVEGMWEDEEAESYPRYDVLGSKLRWGPQRSEPLPRYRGRGSTFTDGFYPIVHDTISERHGYKPKFAPSARFADGPNANLPVLADCFDVNEPLGPGESRVGCAIFGSFPVEEYQLFYDAVNLLSVQSVERKAKASSEGFKALRKYRDLYPEGAHIEEVKQLLEMEGNPGGLAPLIDRLQSTFRKGLESMCAESGYEGFSKEIELLTRGAKLLHVFKVEEALEVLASFRAQYKESEHFEDADRLYTLAKRNLIPRARQAAEEILARHDVESLPDVADMFYLKVSGLKDPVLKEGNAVYADEPILVLVFQRKGAPSYRDLQSLKKIEERWIPGERRMLRKIAHSKLGDD